MARAVDPDVTILALDLARRMGFAVGSLRRLMQHGYYDLDAGNDLGDLLNACQSAVHDLCAVHSPSLIVVEAPLSITAQTAQVSAEQQLGLDAAVRMYACLKRIPWHRVSAQTVRKVVLGRSAFGGSENAKRAVMAWAQAQGWAPKSHDVADALVLLSYQLGGLPGSRAEAAAFA